MKPVYDTIVKLNKLYIVINKIQYVEYLNIITGQLSPHADFSNNNTI